MVIRKEISMEKSQEEKQGEGKHTPGFSKTDTGWAWIVLISAFAENFLLVGTHISFGIYYKEFLEYFQTSASMISFALSVQTIFISIGSLLVMSVGPRFCSTRVYVMIGGITGSGAYMLNSFAPDASFLMLSQGVCFGMTHSFVHGPTIVTLGKYFEKRRGLATTLSTVGASVGGLVMPILVRFLINNYGLQGSLMIVSAMLLNFFVTGALLRPFHGIGNSSRRTEVTTDKSEEQVTQQTLESESLLKKKSPSVNNHIDQSPKFIVEKDGNELTLIVPEKSASTSDLSIQYDRLFPEPVERLRTFSSSSHTRKRIIKDNTEKPLSPLIQNLKHNISRELMVSSGDITGSCVFSSLNMDTHQRENSTNHHGQHIENENSKTSEPISFCLRLLYHVFDRRVMTNYRFLLYMPVAFTAIIGTAQFLTFVPPHAADIGLTDEEVSYLFIISGASDITSKLFVSMIADCHFIKRYQLIAFDLIVFGTVANFVRFFTDFKRMIILVVAYGTCGQMYFGLFPVILADFVGIENLSTALGIVILIHGFALSVSTPILGYIRDVTGSFVGSFHFMAISMVISGIILLMEPLVRRLERRKRKNAKI